MKRFAFFVLLVGLCTTLTLAQNRGQGRGRVTVSGTVIDKEDNSPIMQLLSSCSLCRIAPWRSVM